MVGNKSPGAFKARYFLCYFGAHEKGIGYSGISSHVDVDVDVDVPV